MTDRERTLAALNYERYDRMPIVHFGFWQETLARWVREGHLSAEEAEGWSDGNFTDRVVGGKLGFDFNWRSLLLVNAFLDPPFTPEVIERQPDGFLKVRDEEGVVVLQRPGATSIPAEVDHLLKTRADWEKHYLPRLQNSDDRINCALVRANNRLIRWNQGGSAFLRDVDRDYLYGLSCGSLFGKLRNIAGLTGVSCLWVDDPDLFCEMVDTVGELCYCCTKAVLDSGARFDFAHFWEDICFRGGPLVIPAVFEEKVGPHYRRITDLVRRHGITIVSLDCDGKIDALIPIWLRNGVNTMFPIEVGNWNASIAPWRRTFGRALRGVGGMDKRVFARDFAAVRAEIERLKPLVELGGYIPCPDHRIPPDAKWDNVRYYCDQMRKTFG